MVQIAPLLAGAKQSDRLALDRLPDEPWQKTLTVVPHEHPRPVGIGQAQHTGADPEDVPVEQVVHLAGVLVHPVHVHRPDRVRLIDRQILGPPVNLPGPGVDDLHARVELAARLEKVELAATVDLQVRPRVSHAVDVADLAREVKDQFLALHQVVETVRVPDIGDVDAEPLLVAADVVKVAAVVRDHRVHQQHLGVEVNQPPRQVAADEPEAARDQHPPAAIEVAVSLHRPLCRRDIRCALAS